MPELDLDDSACSRCGQCADVCPLRIITLPGGGHPRYVDSGPQRCIVCGHCEAVCPTGAVSVGDPRLDPATYGTEDAEIGPEVLGSFLRMRRSIRHYRDEQVDRTTIGRLMDIVRFAPTGSNSQSVQWLIIHDTSELRRLTEFIIDWMRSIISVRSPITESFSVEGMVRSWEKGRDPVCRHAPHLVVAHVPENSLTGRTDAIIALSHLEIAAPAFGLGACWAGFFQFAVENWPPLRSALALPPGHLPVYAMMLGYPAVRYHRPPKRNRATMSWL